MSSAQAQLEQRLRVACRTVGRAGLTHAYGHCSLRLDASEMLVGPPKPPGLTLDSDSATRVPIDGPLPPGVLPEVRLHQKIYERRPEIGGIVRFQSPKLMSLSTLGGSPEVRHGLGTYFAPRAPYWADPRLARDDASAAAIAETLGGARAVVMRGNGAIAVADTIENAVVLAWFLEDAARVELDVLATGIQGALYSAAESADRAVSTGRLFERMWDYLTAGETPGAK